MIQRSSVRVAHLTSAHAANDVRIFHKECVTLADAGYQVTLVVTGGASETVKGVRIVSVPRTPGRLGRAVLGTFRLGQCSSTSDPTH